ncbi:MAG: hypothetical protein ABIM89_06445 [Mycobacteriales bacterium]
MMSVLLGVLTFAVVALAARRMRASADVATRSGVRRRSAGSPSHRAERLGVLERGVADAVANGEAFHQRLRPQLRFVVIDRLRRNGIELDTDPRAAEVLGSVAWSLLRSDDTAPNVPRTAGLTDHEVRALTEMLERIR